MCSAFIPAATSGTGGFSGWVQAVAGNNTLTIEAEDFSPQANRRTATYWVQVNGTNRVPGYDFNGNLVDNGSGQTYEWDAENRLVKITYADQTSTEFRYDGQSRRVGITEKDAARVVTSEKRYLWAEGAQPAEERAADGRTVVKQYHAQGEFLPGATAPLNKVFYTKDHLGSVRELVNGNGTLQTRYDYDLWGGRTKITGTVESEVGYTGHHHHGKSGLMLTWYRAYDPVTGRWLSRDPIGEAGGINLYGYVSNNPVRYFDPNGESLRDTILNILTSVMLWSQFLSPGDANKDCPTPPKHEQQQQQQKQDNAKPSPETPSTDRPKPGPPEGPLPGSQPPSGPAFGPPILIMPAPYPGFYGETTDCGA